MSMTYNECCKAVGLNRNQRMPEIEYRWVGYSGGKIVECKNMTEASKYSLHERIITPESAKLREDFHKSKIEKESRAVEMFQKSLREDWDELPDDLFAVCYSEAYIRGHYAGYDEVANYMSDVVYFAQKVLKTVNVKV